MNRDRLAAAIALVEVIPFEHPRYGMPCCQSNNALGTQVITPLGIKRNYRLIRIQNLKDLRFVSRRSERQHRALIAGIAASY